MDKKAIMGMGIRRKVMNKHARWNNCIANQSQSPEYEEGKGTVVAFDDVPSVASIRARLPEYFGDIASNLFAETNYYYDVTKTGIGWHGDTERRIVIGTRFGASEKMLVLWSWFRKDKMVGDILSVKLYEGDMYVMSDYATGHTWKENKKGLTVRHASGPKHTKLKHREQ